MGNIFRFFLITLSIMVISSCGFVEDKLSCEDILENTYSESSLNNFEKNKFNEIIFATDPTNDGEFTAQHIKEQIQVYCKKISRIAIGLSLIHISEPTRPY